MLGDAALFDSIKFRVLRAQDFYTPLALNCQKEQHLPALEVYKNQSPTKGRVQKGLESETGRIRFRRVRFQTGSSVSFLALTEFREENLVSSFQPFMRVLKRIHRVFLSQNSAEFGVRTQ